VIPPSGNESSVLLSKGQCRINGSIVGEWRFVYRNETYAAFVAEEKQIYAKEAEKPGATLEGVMPLFLLLFLIPVTALVFFIRELALPPVEFKKEYDGEVVRISLVNRFEDMDDVKVIDRVPKNVREMSLEPKNGILTWKKERIKRGGRFCVSYSMETWGEVGMAEARGTRGGKDVVLFSELVDKRAYRKGEGTKRLKKSDNNGVSGSLD
jgi:hypothetical protein